MINNLMTALKKLVKEAVLSDPDAAVMYYRKKGVAIGQNVKLYHVLMDGRRPFLISIGDNVILTNCRLLTHDASMFLALAHTKIGRIEIGSNVFVGADSIILPDVKIGNYVIVGAGTIVAKDIPDNSVVVGNPARIIGSYHDFIAKHQTRITEFPLFENHQKMDEEEKEEMKSRLKCTYGYSRLLQKGK